MAAERNLYLPYGLMAVTKETPRPIIRRQRRDIADTVGSDIAITTRFVRSAGYDAVRSRASLRSVQNGSNEMQSSESLSYGIRTESAGRHLGQMEKSTYSLTQNGVHFVSMRLKVAIARYASEQILSSDFGSVSKTVYGAQVTSRSTQHESVRRKFGTAQLRVCGILGKLNLQPTQVHCD
jgi:hypothetical protein